MLIILKGYILRLYPTDEQKELINKTIGVHPNRNDYTIFIKFKTLVKLIEEHGNEIVYLDI